MPRLLLGQGFSRPKYPFAPNELYPPLTDEPKQSRSHLIDDKEQLLIVRIFQRPLYHPTSLPQERLHLKAIALLFSGSFFLLSLSVILQAILSYASNHVLPTHDSAQLHLYNNSNVHRSIARLANRAFDISSPTSTQENCRWSWEVEVEVYPRINTKTLATWLVHYNRLFFRSPLLLTSL